MIHAACKGAAYKAKIPYGILDPFFPEKGQSRHAAQTIYCMVCPVINECEQYAIAIEARHGICGGNYKNETE